MIIIWIDIGYILIGPFTLKKSKIVKNFGTPCRTELCLKLLNVLSPSLSLTPNLTLTSRADTLYVGHLEYM